MKINQILESRDSCNVCGQTPCNCTHLTESASNIGAQIKAAYQKIYNAGDDAVEFAYYDSPIFAQYWDEYEGDLDSIIAEVEPSELQIILDELTSAAEDQGVAEGSLNEFAPNDGGDGDGPDEYEILHRLAAMWWLGTEQQMIKAQRTLASMGWEIGEDEGYDDGGVFVVRANDEHGKSYISWPHEDLQLNEQGVAEGEVTRTPTGLTHRATDRYGAGDDDHQYKGGRSGFADPGKYARDLETVNKQLVKDLDASMGITWKNRGTKGVEVDEGGDKVGNMDADKFDAAMDRLKKLAGAGPLKTVYDPKKRVYKNVPTAVQPKK